LEEGKNGSWASVELKEPLFCCHNSGSSVSCSLAVGDAELILPSVLPDEDYSDDLATSDNATYSFASPSCAEANHTSSPDSPASWPYVQLPLWLVTGAIILLGFILFANCLLGVHYRRLKVSRWEGESDSTR
jgi:hypothetical protein